MLTKILRIAVKFGFGERVERLLCLLHNRLYHEISWFSCALDTKKEHPKHRLTDYHQWFADRMVGQKSILDVGCGNGALAEKIAKNAEYYVGIDIVEEMLDKARKRSLMNAEFICGDIITYEFSVRFDVAILSNVLEHIRLRHELLKKLSLISKKILVRVPAIDRDWLTLYKASKSIEYRLDVTHELEYTVETLRAEIESAGLIVSDLRVRYGEIYCVASSRRDVDSV